MDEHRMGVSTSMAVPSTAGGASRSPGECPEAAGPSVGGRQEVSPAPNMRTGTLESRLIGMELISYVRPPGPEEVSPPLESEDEIEEVEQEVPGPRGVRVVHHRKAGFAMEDDEDVSVEVR